MSPINAQLLDPEKEWFNTEDFFIEADIKNHKIHSINISKSIKKDKEIIKKAPKELSYIFDSDGYLFSASKNDNRFGRKTIEKKTYQYDHFNRLRLMNEDFGHYQFDYIHHYTEGDISEQIKIDHHSKDTLFHKRFLNIKNDSSQIISTLNDIGKPYMNKVIIRQGAIKTIETTYTKSANFKKETYIYSDGKISSKKITNRRLNRLTEISTNYVFTSGKLSDILYFEGEEKTKRLGMVYDERGLLKNVVIRNFKAKDVEIYHFNYTFYSSN